MCVCVSRCLCNFYIYFPHGNFSTCIPLYLFYLSFLSIHLSIHPFIIPRIHSLNIASGDMRIERRKERTPPPPLPSHPDPPIILLPKNPVTNTQHPTFPRPCAARFAFVHRTAPLLSVPSLVSPRGFEKSEIAVLIAAGLCDWIDFGAYRVLLAKVLGKVLLCGGGSDRS